MRSPLLVKKIATTLDVKALERQTFERNYPRAAQFRNGMIIARNP